MKLHFDSKQEFQLEAIKAITDKFEEQPLSGGGTILTENGVQNKIDFCDLDRFNSRRQKHAD